jgi:mitochondrial fission protein ELM1
MAATKTIWQICDNKRGHENQSSGLIRALSKHLPIKVVRLEITKYKASWWQAALGSFPAVQELPAPDLIIATGSQTHATLLAAGRVSGAPTLLIMAPPCGMTRFFDLCVVPAHDQRQAPNILETTGAMNLVEPNWDKDQHSGLFLIGGPSQHHNWDETALLKQISSILKSNAELHWTLTTSRRTPGNTTKQLQSIAGNQLTVVPVEKTEAHWLPEQLARSAHVWVTEDSVSMVYEALSSAAKVGILPVPRKTTRSRIIRGLDSLKNKNDVLSYSENQLDLTTFVAPPPLNEAERIAQIVISKFFN